MRLPRRTPARAAVVLLLLVLCSASAFAQPARQHPYLYFTAQDIPALKARLQQEPFATRWQRLLEHAERCLNRPAPSARRVMGNSRNSLGVAGTCAFAYALTGDRRYGLRAKVELEALLQADTWHTGYSWNHGADLSTAELCAAFALVWDWCYDTFSPEERDAVRAAALRLGITPYLGSVEQYHDWWTANPVTNWRGVCNGGCGLAALALYDESPDARRAADHAWDGLQDFMRKDVLEDGGGHEGVMYWTYGMEFSNYFLTAAARMRGDDGGLFKVYTDRLAGYWPIYMQGPDGRFANFNDMGEDTAAGLYSQSTRRVEGGPNAPLCALFESHVPGGDRLLLWAADNGGANFYWEGASPFWFLWRRDCPPAGPKPRLQDEVLFRGAGHAIFSSPTLWLVLNGGWTSNASHSNNDLGSFVLVAGGERFVNDPGYGITETQNHSSILVDGKGQPRNVSGKFLRFGKDKGFAYLACDMSSCYPGTSLTRWVRHAVMVDGAYIVLLDDLAASAPANFEWRLQTRRPFHAGQGDAAVTLLGNETDLHVIAAAPQGAVVQAATRSMWAEGRRGTTMQTVSVQPPAPTAQTTVLCVLYPTASGAAAPTVSTGQGGVLKVTAPGRQDTIVFEQTEGGWTLSSVNGESAAAIPDGKERSLVPFRQAPAPSR